MRVIVNPAAGKGQGAKAANAIREAFSPYVSNPDVRLTRGPGHAAELAREAVDLGIERVIVAGGDGTVGEAAQALSRSGVTLGVVPLGTGNDLARSLGLQGGGIREAVAAIACGYTREIDVALDGERAFVSVLGVGFPAAVARTANGYRRLRGTVAFAFAVYSEIRRMKAFPVNFRLDGGGVVQARVTSVLVQNTPTTGGGMLTAPGARIDDGYLEVLLVDDISRPALTWNFPKVYRGRHLDHPKFKAYRCKSLELDCAFQVGKMGDGEDWGGSPVRVTVHPRALRVFAVPQR